LSGGAANLDATPLANAVQGLREGLRRHQQDTKDEQIRDGLIQRFEFTYELSHRMLRRYLAETAATPGAIEAMTFADLIRTGNEQGLFAANGLHGAGSARCGPVPATRTTPRSRWRWSAESRRFLSEAEHLVHELQRRLA
jgi:hypothetical protein